MTSPVLPHRPYVAEHIATLVSYHFTIRTRRGFRGGSIFNFSPGCIALKTDERALEAN